MIPSTSQAQCTTEYRRLKTVWLAGKNIWTMLSWWAMTPRTCVLKSGRFSKPIHNAASKRARWTLMIFCSILISFLKNILKYWINIKTEFTTYWLMSFRIPIFANTSSFANLLRWDKTFVLSVMMLKVSMHFAEQTSQTFWTLNAITRICASSNWNRIIDRHKILSTPRTQWSKRTAHNFQRMSGQKMRRDHWLNLSRLFLTMKKAG